MCFVLYFSLFVFFSDFSYTWGGGNDGWSFGFGAGAVGQLGALQLSKVAGLHLWPLHDERAFVTAALAQAALEIPFSKTGQDGVDPLFEANRNRVVLAASAKLSQAGTLSFVIKLLLKRIFLRTV